jgi:glucokinase
MAETIIGVDLGGTRIRAARLDETLHIQERVETFTLADQGLSPTLERIKAQVRRVYPNNPAELAGIGVSAPGPLNPETGVIIRPPNLPGWDKVHLSEILHQEFGVPVYVGNDANVAALAEVARGAARGYRHAIYITISTGIGSGIIVDGRMLLGKSGLAAEAGHMIMLVEDNVSSLEEEAAGPDMALQARRRIEAGESSMISTMVNGNLSTITGSVVGKAAQANDPLALEIVGRSGKLVGLGIVNLLHLFNPEIIVVGGGVTNLGDLIFRPMRAAIERYAINEYYWKDLVLTTPGLGEDVSIIGAAALVATQGGVIDVAEVTERLSR